MKHGYTHIAALLDASGSMAGLTLDTIGGYNRFLKAQKEAPGEATISLWLFNTRHWSVYDWRDVREAPELTTVQYLPGGGTALLDGLGSLIQRTGVALREKPEHLRPEKVVVFVTTDGEENSSHEYTKERVKQMVEEQRSKYSWEFVFVGANIDSFAVAGGLGFAAANSMNMAHNAVGTQSMYDSFAANTVQFRSGAKADMSWEDKDKTAQEQAGAKP